MGGAWRTRQTRGVLAGVLAAVLVGGLAPSPRALAADPVPFDLHTKLCPADFQSSEDLTPEARLRCLDVVLPADAPVIPQGFATSGYGGTAAFSYEIHDDAGGHTLADATLVASGACDADLLVCAYTSLAYRLAATGDLRLLLHAPAGTRVVAFEGHAEPGGRGFGACIEPNECSMDLSGQTSGWGAFYLLQNPPDTTVPTATVPVVRPDLDGVLSWSVPVNLQWKAADAAWYELDRYRVQVMRDGVVQTAAIVPASLLTSPFWLTRVAPGHVYLYRITVYDFAGHHFTTAWTPATWASIHQERSTLIRWSGTWHAVWDANAAGGSYRWSDQARAAATMTFTGRAIAWVGRYSSRVGFARVYVDGHRVATVDLRRLTTSRDRRLLFTQRFTTSGTHTIRIVVDSGWVPLDALVVLH